MTNSPYAAWRFAHPDLDTGTRARGLSISSGGGIEMADGPAAIRQAILVLLTTRPGERVMRPSYGCDIYRLIFSPNDNTTAGLVIHFVRRALERWESRIEILKLDAAADPDDGDRLNIFLEYRLRAFQSTEQLIVVMNLAGSRG